MSKRKVKQEVDLQCSALRLIEKRKTKQCNQTDITLTSIIIGQKSTVNQVAQYMVENYGNIWKAFR